jgi:hypothetical protein
MSIFGEPEVPEPEIKYTREYNPNSLLKARRKELGLRGIKSLLGMSSGKDPFNKADWFEYCWNNYSSYGMHLRGLHYKMVHSKELLTLWDRQTRYENKDLHWQKLIEASVSARVLRVVRDDILLDRQSRARPSINITVRKLPEPEFEAHVPDYTISLPSVYTILPRVGGMTDYGDFTYEVMGYDYSDEMQPSIIEIWSEVEDPILRSLASTNGINYVPNTGYATVSRIRKMLRRIKASGKPGVILYCADFDPAGVTMVRSLGRYCQFSAWELQEIAKEEAPGVRVDHVAVTPEQKAELGIPGIPLKEKDKRVAGFEEKYGKDAAVEVEALEAVRPGYLRRIFQERIDELVDPDLREKLEEAENEANDVVNAALKEVQDSHQEGLDEVARQAGQVSERYGRLFEALNAEVEQRYRRLQRRFYRELQPTREELEEIQSEIEEEVENLDVDLPEHPEPETEENEDRVWLLDPERDFLEQTTHFREVLGTKDYE